MLAAGLSWQNSQQLQPLLHRRVPDTILLIVGHAEEKGGELPADAPQLVTSPAVHNVEEALLYRILAEDQIPQRLLDPVQSVLEKSAVVELHTPSRRLVQSQGFVLV